MLKNIWMFITYLYCCFRWFPCKYVCTRWSLTNVSICFPLYYCGYSLLFSLCCFASSMSSLSKYFCLIYVRSRPFLSFIILLIVRKTVKLSVVDVCCGSYGYTFLVRNLYRVVTRLSSCIYKKKTFITTFHINPIIEIIWFHLDL